MKKYVCTICGYIYDEAKGIPEAGIALGTKWNDLPEDWTCPLCGTAKSDFKEQAEGKEAAKGVMPASFEDEEARELNFAELSALCSNLAKGCEKQYLSREAELFWKLSDYYKQKGGMIAGQSFGVLLSKIQDDLEKDYVTANIIADEKPDRGAKRALVWSEKVTRMLNSLIARYEKEKDSMLENTNIYVCEICGFVYVGDTPPEICPVCKVPNKKITKVERG